MIFFTKEERTVLLFFVLAVFFGSVLHYTFKKYPFLHDAVNLIDSDKLYNKIDLNTASAEELMTIPYIGEYTARNIVQYRRQHGPFTAIAQVKNVSGIREKNFAKFHQYLKVR